VDLDVPDGPVPLQISDLLGSLDLDPTVQKKGEGRGSPRVPGRSTPARLRAQVVDAGDAPGVSGGDG
jgi:hypothetical protein